MPLTPGIMVFMKLDLWRRCGPANHSVRLAKKGYKVFALDIIPSLLAYAKEKGEAEGVNVAFLKQDMQEFTLPVCSLPTLKCRIDRRRSVPCA